jgi:hypothetical protein
MAEGVLIYFNELWRKAMILSRKDGRIILRLEGSSLQIADTEENLCKGPLQMSPRPVFSNVLVEVFPAEAKLKSGFYGYARAWLGRHAFVGIDVGTSADGQLYPYFQPAFFREAISKLNLTDEEIALLMDSIARELLHCPRELVAKNYPATVPATA